MKHHEPNRWASELNHLSYYSKKNKKLRNTNLGQASEKSSKFKTSDFLA